jgi:glycine cleavage system H protein
MAKVGEYSLPDELYYHKDFCWAKVEGPECVRVGLIDFAQAQAGDITYIDLPFEGDEIVANGTCGKIQSSKWIGKLIAPISGTIVEINSDLESDATLVNQDCYGKGWIFTVRPSDLEAELKVLYHADAAIQWLGGEIERVEREKSAGKDFTQ